MRNLFVFVGSVAMSICLATQAHAAETYPYARDVYDAANTVANRANSFDRGSLTAESLRDSIETLKDRISTLEQQIGSGGGRTSRSAVANFSCGWGGGDYPGETLTITLTPETGSSTQVGAYRIFSLGCSALASSLDRRAGQIDSLKTIAVCYKTISGNFHWYVSKIVLKPDGMSDSVSSSDYGDDAQAQRCMNDAISFND